MKKRLPSLSLTFLIFLVSQAFGQSQAKGKITPLPPKTHAVSFESINGVFYGLHPGAETKNLFKISSEEKLQTLSLTTPMSEMDDIRLYWYDGTNLVIISKSYKKQKATIYGILIDPATFKVKGSAVKLFEFESKTEPGISLMVSPDKKKMGLLAIPRKIPTLNASPGETIATEFYMTVYTSQLEQVWQKRMDYELSSDDYTYHVDEIIDNEGNWYSMGEFIDVKFGGVKVLKTDLTVYDDDGASSFKKDIDLDVENVKEYYMLLVGDKLVFTGTKGVEDVGGFVNGTFYCEFKKNNLERLDCKQNDFDQETLDQFITNAQMEKQMEKGRGIYGLRTVMFPVALDDGTVAFGVRRISLKDAGSEVMEAGTMAFFFYGSGNEAYNQAIIKTDQSSDRARTNIGEYVDRCGNQICVMFNDAPENSSLLDEGKPAEYSMGKLGQIPPTITSLVTISKTGEMKRETLADYKTDKFIGSYFTADPQSGSMLVYGYGTAPKPSSFTETYGSDPKVMIIHK